MVSVKGSVSFLKKNKNPTLDLGKQGNSIPHQGNQEEMFPLGNVDEMLILVCFYNSGSVPAFWLNHSSLTLSCDCNSLWGRCSVRSSSHKCSKEHGASEPSFTDTYMSRFMWLIPHKKYLSQECSELPRFEGGCKNMTFFVPV